MNSAAQTKPEVSKVQDSTRQDVLKRLNYSAGHLEGIRRMVEEAKYCPDVLKQTFAVRRALAKMEETNLGGHEGRLVALGAGALGGPRRTRQDDVPRPARRERPRGPRAG